MSLTEVLEAVRILTPDEQERVRALLEQIKTETRAERFKRLRGSAKDEKFPPLTLDILNRERREMWRGMMSEDLEK